MLSRCEQYTIFDPSGDSIGSEPNMCRRVTPEPSGFIKAISLVLGLATALLCISGASWVSVTIPPWDIPVAIFELSPMAPGPDSATVMVRIEDTPIEGSARTKTILSFIEADEPEAGLAAEEATHPRITQAAKADRDKNVERDINPPSCGIVARFRNKPYRASKSKRSCQQEATPGNDP